MPDTSAFISDIDMPGLIYGLTIRSPAARGRLAGIEAPKLPAAYKLITAQDIPGENRVDDLPAPVLAAAALSYTGEPVALLFGPDKSRLEALAAQIRVIIQAPDPEPPGPAPAPARREISLGDPKGAFSGAAAVAEGIYTRGIQAHY
ncbi:MAG: xanthine dehydrogenase family protein molybdopterin-binding subunit, partial [Treponema sp.]|nr:xanthine dehydrogenase family protein molybdopterin-binding subunit [Treponema sp.]